MAARDEVELVGTGCMQLTNFEVHYAAAQLPSEKDEDQLVIHEAARFADVAFALFDGHGGRYAAEYSRDELLNILPGPSFIQDQQQFESNVTAVFKESDARIQAHDRSGTTANIVFASEDVAAGTLELCAAWVGDSRSAMTVYKGRNQVSQEDLTVDHSPTNLTELARMARVFDITIEYKLDQQTSHFVDRHSSKAPPGEIDLLHQTASLLKSQDLASLHNNAPTVRFMSQQTKNEEGIGNNVCFKLVHPKGTTTLVSRPHGQNNKDGNMTHLIEHTQRTPSSKALVEAIANRVHHEMAAEEGGRGGVPVAEARRSLTRDMSSGSSSSASMRMSYSSMRSNSGGPAHLAPLSPLGSLERASLDDALGAAVDDGGAAPVGPDAIPGVPMRQRPSPIDRVDPIPRRLDPIPRRSDPIAHGSDPIAHGSDPIAHGSDPIAHGSDPIAHGSPPPDRCRASDHGCPVGEGVVDPERRTPTVNERGALGSPLGSPGDSDDVSAVARAVAARGSAAASPGWDASCSNGGGMPPRRQASALAVRTTSCAVDDDTPWGGLGAPMSDRDHLEHAADAAAEHERVLMSARTSASRTSASRTSAARVSNNTDLIGGLMGLASSRGESPRSSARTHAADATLSGYGAKQAEEPAGSRPTLAYDDLGRIAATTTTDDTSITFAGTNVVPDDHGEQIYVRKVTEDLAGRGMSPMQSNRGRQSRGSEGKRGRKKKKEEGVVAKERALASAAVADAGARPNLPDYFVARLQYRNQRCSNVRLFSIEGNSVAFTRSLGDRHAPEVVTSIPEFTRASIKKGQRARIIVASDGLWDTHDAADAFKAAKPSNKPAEAAKRLCAEAMKGRQRARIHRDDITVIIVDVIPRVESAKCGCF